MINSTELKLVLNEFPPQKMDFGLYLGNELRNVNVIKY